LSHTILLAGKFGGRPNTKNKGGSPRQTTPAGTTATSVGSTESVAVKKVKPDVIEVGIGALKSATYAGSTLPRLVADITHSFAIVHAQAQGRVTESLPGAMFRVEVESSKSIALCTISGRIRKNYVKILVGDAVTVELSIYDISKGRITYRKK
jgi:translation initiation factor IF-1